MKTLKTYKTIKTLEIYIKNNYETQKFGTVYANLVFRNDDDTIIIVHNESGVVGQFIGKEFILDREERERIDPFGNIYGTEVIDILTIIRD